MEEAVSAVEFQEPLPPPPLKVWGELVRAEEATAAVQEELQEPLPPPPLKVWSEQVRAEAVREEFQERGEDRTLTF